MDIPGLALLLQHDPPSARALQALIQQLATSLDAEQWAIERLSTLHGAHTRTALLSLLVEEARSQTGMSDVWAVLWTGDMRKNISFQTLVVGGRARLVPAPEQVSRTVVAEVARSQKPVWIENTQVDNKFSSAESVMAVAGTIACLPLGSHGALYLSGQPTEGRIRTRTRLRLEALVKVARVFLIDPLPPSTIQIPGLVGNTRPMQELFAAIRSFAPMPWPALILGETGTGKEAVARALHTLSPRSDEPFLAVNCAAIPENLAESLIFGHERGAFTGADRRKEGIVERVGAGTLFLDEVGELPASLQAKLLRLLQESRFERIGGDVELRFKGRIVAATLKPLEQVHGKEVFRSDLYHRLAACILRVPPLRDRRDDLPALARCLLERACQQVGIAPLILSGRASELLSHHSWPGNVRELENSLKTAIARAIAWGDTELVPEHFELTEARPEAPREAPSSEAPGEGMGLLAATEDFQRRMVRNALQSTQGNRQAAADRLGVSKQWLYRLLAKWGGEA